MKKIAIIAAAGWKGGGSGTEYVASPEPLLPLGNGETIISRLAKQLYYDFGFQIIIGAGMPGCTFRSFARFCPGCEISKELEEELLAQGLTLDDSPWTWEHISYLQELGGVALMPNPGIGNCHDTYCRIIDSALPEKWDRLLMLHGDMMFTNKFLTDVFALPWPCQFSMHPVHTMFLLTPSGLPPYRSFAEGHRSGWKTYTEKAEMAMDWPGGIRGVHKVGIPCYAMRTIGRQNVEIEWLDVDDPPKYKVAKQRIANGEM